MSAAILDDFSPQDLTQDKHNVNAERTRILNMVSRKIQDKTLTLEETTALYEKFNNTFSEHRSNEPQEVDESWALKLIQESEQEEVITVEDNASLQTRVNGIPHLTPVDTNSLDNDSTSPANDDILMSKVVSSDDTSEFKSQDLNFNIKEHFNTGTDSKKHDAFANFVIAASVVAVGTLLGFAIFF